MRDPSKDPAGPYRPTESDWFSAARKPLQEVNRRLIDLLAIAAEDPDELRLPLANQLRDILHELDPASRGRAAACPYLLVDTGFQDVVRWSRAAAEVDPIDVILPCFPHAQAIELSHMTLVLAWTLVHNNLAGAGILLGVSPACAEIIADLRLQELQRIATDYCGWARPRWENRPDVWRGMLTTARAADGSSLDSLGLQGLQLFFGDLLT